MSQKTVVTQVVNEPWFDQMLARKMRIQSWSRDPLDFACRKNAYIPNTSRLHEIATQAIMTTNTYGSPAFQESIRRYAGTERPESNLVMRLYGLVSQERMLIDKKNRCQPPNRTHPQHGAYRKSLKRIVRQLLRVQCALRSECDAYNSFHSRNVCTAMHYKFPRELRDMVYEHITSEEVTVCTEPELASTADPTISSMSSPLHFLTERWYSPSPCTFKDTLCGAHYWRIEVVGYEVQKELTESWYHNATFHLEFPRGTREWDHDATFHRDFPRRTRQYYRPAIVLDHLPRMLWYDRFGLGLKPEQLLRNIVVVLDLPAADDYFGSILTGLDNLALLKQGAKIHLRLRLPHAGRFLEEETTAHALQHWLHYVHPSLWRLKRAGYDLLVTFDRVTTETAYTQVLDRWKEEFEIEAKKEVPATTSSVLTSS